ncbi:replication protein A 70 kDa DNA-binding subunit [Ctenocephalides felis]|uniref:replication protein A 70 kDa DNA-binding subunit n=1 Tax=Ctenocephalides felis TaxID=7515 RepID=UPI000E6E166F|nr:replication protein A 70 kDa DNA-binding subunit [Ctenocephalides felis]
MASQLTSGCLMGIMTGAVIENPIMQILGSKKVMGNGNTERYRLLISDGRYFHSFAMLATQLNGMLVAGELSDNTVVCVDRYITSVLNNTGKGDRRVLIILGLTVVRPGEEVGEKLGSPVALPENPEGMAGQNSSSGVSGTVTSAPPPSSGNSYNKKPTYESSVTLVGQQLTHPIVSLSPYQNKWVIKARVMNKSAIRTWSNSKGEGKLFSMDLFDESGEIRATAFKEQCDKFYDMIQVDKVYYISKCQLKPANKQFSTLKNDYEMTFTNDTQVAECMDADIGVPEVSYEFVKIKDIGEKETNSFVDVIGICKDCTNVVQLTSKAGRELRKRELTLVDNSGACINLTLWGDEAENFDGSLQPVILVKGARLNEFGGGKSLGTVSGTCLKINPDIPEAHKLRGWFDNGGANADSTSLSAMSGLGSNASAPLMTLKEAKIRQLGSGEKPDYFSAKVSINLIRNSNSFYRACPQPDCNKKVIDQQNGQFRCEKCAQDFSRFKYRLMLNVNIGDWSGSRWVTCFNDTAETLLGKSAQEVGELIDNENDTSASEAFFSKLAFTTHVMKLRNKMEFYGDTYKIKSTVVSIGPVNYKEYNASLIKSLETLTGIYQ